jgi:hypothetical protein
MLSTDAAPVIARYVETHEISEDDSGWLIDYAAYVDAYSGESPRKFNVSHACAVSSLQKAGVSLPHEEAQSYE